MISLSVGNKDLGKIKGVNLEWNELKTKLTTHKKRSGKGGVFIVGGRFKGEDRVGDQMIDRTMLTIDCDDINMSIDELDHYLRDNIDVAYAAYSTFNHTPDKPRIRIVVPLSRGVSVDEYEGVAKRFTNALDALEFDGCSFTANQFMYMPYAANMDGVWSYCQDGIGFLQVQGVVAVSNDLIVADDDFMNGVYPVEPGEVEKALESLPAAELDYQEWVEVGMALKTQYQGTDEGLSLFESWSKKDKERYQVGLCSKKWRSFNKTTITIKTLFFLANRNKKEVIDATFDHLLVEAESIADHVMFKDFCKKVLDLPKGAINDVELAMIANKLYTSFGQKAGVTKADIKKSLTKRKARFDDGISGSMQSWMNGWYYIETTCQFYNSTYNYAIKGEAFNVKFSRVPQVGAAETSAAHYATALVANPIPCVVDTIFWPGADLELDYEGKAMINTYRERGLNTDAVDLQSDFAQQIVKRFLDHIDNTFVDESERVLFLDWLCHVVQKPGERVNWSILLQGSQGVGKTFFVNVLQAALGENIQALAAGALSGQFTGWAYGSTVIAVEEIKIDNSEKFKILNKLKPFISNDRIAIEQKGRDHRTVPNFCSYIFLTNFIDAIPLDDDDRRFCVLFTRWQTKKMMESDLGGAKAASDYFKQLFNDVNNNGEVISKFLKTRVISESFDHLGRAPVTKARGSVVSMGMSNDQCVLEDLIDSYRCPVINESIIDTTYLNQRADGDFVEVPKTTALKAIMLEKGYRQVTNRYIKINGKKHYLWFAVGCAGDIDSLIQSVKDFHGVLNNPDVPF